MKDVSLVKCLHSICHPHDYAKAIKHLFKMIDSDPKIYFTSGFHPAFAAQFRQSRESIKNDGKITLPSKVSEIVKITNKNAWSFYGFQQPKPRPNAEKAKKIETRNRFELLTEKQKNGTILCSDVPKWVIVGSDILKSHFSLFGTIKDVCMEGAGVTVDLTFFDNAKVIDFDD